MKKRLLKDVKSILVLLFLASAILVLCFCESGKLAKTDLPGIKKRGKLVALTGYSATSYFIYKGQPMGYEYELLTRLAKHLDLELEIKIENNLQRMFERLNGGEADIIAHGLTITKQRKKIVNFTSHLFTTRQVLVQRKPDNWREMKIHEINEVLIRNPIGLIGKRIHVLENSSFVERLHHLSEEIGGEIIVVEVGGDTTTEQLIQAVSEKEIDYTIADQHVAMINQAYFSNLDVKTPISLPQRIAWAVRKNAAQLHMAVNKWLSHIQQKAVFYVIHNKYFKDRREFVRRVKSEFLSVTGGKISRYDELFQTYAQKINWDWRLLASMSYQESQFNPRAKSWSGAVGIMQLLPRTGRQYGARNLREPAQNIEAAVNYISWLNDYWREAVPDSLERIKFILASYNVGFGHVQDARRLAEKHDKNPAVWARNVAYYILRLSDKKYFSDPVVKYGYCRGLEPYNYVQEILERYQQYLKFIQA